MIHWKNLTSIEQFQDLVEESSFHPIAIFKHSTRCSISDAAKSRLERQWDDSKAPNTSVYYLDLLNYRAISNAIAETFHVEHQSPQVIVIKNGKPVYDASHMNIQFENIKSKI